MADFLFAPKYSKYHELPKVYGGNVYGNQYCYCFCPNNYHHGIDAFEHEYVGDNCFVLRSQDNSCNGYCDYTGADSDGNDAVEWSLRHILRSLLIGPGIEPPPLLQSGVGVGDGSLVALCSASSSFGLHFDGCIVDLERQLVNRAWYVTHAREELPGLSGSAGTSMAVSALGCCPFLPVPDACCPDWTVWSPVVKQLLGYDRIVDGSWRRIIFLWRVLCIFSSFTLGISEFSRMHSMVASLKEEYVRWHSLGILLKSGRSSFSDLPIVVEECRVRMVEKDRALVEIYDLAYVK